MIARGFHPRPFFASSIQIRKTSANSKPHVKMMLHGSRALAKKRHSEQNHKRPWNGLHIKSNHDVDLFNATALKFEE
jgi:hypothetical protein